MRFDPFLQDLAAQFERASSLAQAGEAAERREAELAGVCLLDRLRPGAPDQLVIRLRAGETVRGRVSARGADWFCVAQDARSHLIALAAVVSVRGARSAGLLPRSELEERLPLSQPLRALARRSRRVTLAASGEQVAGRLGAVGRDHVVVHVSDPVRHTVFVPLAALERVSVDGGV